MQSKLIVVLKRTRQKRSRKGSLAYFPSKEFTKFKIKRYYHWVNQILRKINYRSQLQNLCKNKRFNKNPKNKKRNLLYLERILIIQIFSKTSNQAPQNNLHLEVLYLEQKYRVKEDLYLVSHQLERCFSMQSHQNKVRFLTKKKSRQILFRQHQRVEIHFLITTKENRIHYFLWNLLSQKKRLKKKCP